ncbi:glycosyltransferase [Cellulomonas shaoxiangyii]|uniref:Glycosyltransferase n=1 Tax=Cellulomonas shaoxiangyii TaxID=2566013 RepID=A0A4P7SLT0_9CELL|nr:glycosyltransferase [Cellulomonas shaoxiangyii]TGY80117.1 glycosyltransferase [Cellulomonas shaoxiangyii]
MPRRVEDAVYLLPLRTADPADADTWTYLARVAPVLDVVVVDGSPPDVADVHARHLPTGARHVRVGPPPPGTNGKVVAVRHGLRATTQERVVVADDDVRWEAGDLVRALALLDHAAVVRPQNVFVPAPWHARWDTGRSLLNRALGGDWPGTLLVRRSALPPHGYAEHVLFENLELVRTVRAGGGREHVALDVLGDRRPPSTRRFLDQRVRQAYDSHAQPLRLAAELAVLPLVAAALLHRRPARVAVAAVAVAGVAEGGRRRAGGRHRFPATAALWAPLWCLERGLCAWAALALRAAGGVPYAGTRLRLAAHRERDLRRTAAAPDPRSMT